MNCAGRSTRPWTAERPQTTHPRERCSERGESAVRRGGRVGQGEKRERERERERDVSALLTHLPTGTHRCATTLFTSVPNGLTRTLPLFMRPGPSPCTTKSPAKCLRSIQTTDPNPIYLERSHTEN